MNLTTPITGMAQTGLTSPTYTLTADTVPNGNPSKQWLVTALGGTQSGVAAHKVDSPFLISFSKPASLKSMDTRLMSLTGPIGNVPRNKYRLFVRKQVLINGAFGTAPFDIECYFNVPVGATVQDLVSIKSAISAFGGALTQTPDQWFTSIDQGSI